MAKETVGFALLGAGMVADYHYQAIKANAEGRRSLAAVLAIYRAAGLL